MIWFIILTLVGSYYRKGISGSPIIVNLSRDTATGIESSITGSWESGWKGRASYSIFETYDSNTGRKLSDAPGKIGRLSLSAPLIIPGLFLSGQLNYLSSRNDYFSNTLPQATVVNAILNYDKFWRNADLSLGVFNLFDRTYSSVGTAEKGVEQVRQDGRTIQFKMTVGF